MYTASIESNKKKKKKKKKKHFIWVSIKSARKY